MPIGNITQTISELPAAGKRGVDVQTVFVNKQEDFQDHLQGTTVDELNTLKDQLNSRIGEINSTTTTMNGYADTASAGASTATTKAGEASTSASEALTSRNQAETFKNNASASASTATTKASEASASALSATTKASEASASALSATTKASEASASALSATTKASEASASASTATTKASEASASALSASASASTATTKAGEASTSASEALTSRNQAETFKNNASASASTASQWADNAYNAEVETGRYSAKHWSVVAENAVQAASSVPSGTVITIAKNTAPTGYLKANGALISRTTYSSLFAVIGTTFGAGDGSDTFALPDLRGYFSRGWDDGRGIDTSRVFGSLQQDSYLNHSHTANSVSAGSHTHASTGVPSGGYKTGSNGGLGTSMTLGTVNNTINATIGSGGAHTHTITVDSSTTGSEETRPKNIALLYCIKY